MLYTVNHNPVLTIIIKVHKPQVKVLLNGILANQQKSSPVSVRMS